MLEQPTLTATSQNNKPEKSQFQANDNQFCRKKNEFIIQTLLQHCPLRHNQSTDDYVRRHITWSASSLLTLCVGHDTMLNDR